MALPVPVSASQNMIVIFQSMLRMRKQYWKLHIMRTDPRYPRFSTTTYTKYCNQSHEHENKQIILSHNVLTLLTCDYPRYHQVQNCTYVDKRKYILLHHHVYYHRCSNPTCGFWILTSVLPQGQVCWHQLQDSSDVPRTWLCRFDVRSIWFLFQTRWTPFTWWIEFWRSWQRTFYFSIQFTLL